MKRLTSIILLFVLALCNVRESTAAGTRSSPEATSSYIAPISVGLYRFWQPDGVVRELDVSGPTELSGAFGWTGKVDGDRITLRAGSDVAPEWRGTYVFEKGRLVSFAGAGRIRWFAGASFAPAENPMSMWPEASEDTRDFLKDVNPWRKTNRLKLWLHNPNRAGTLFAEVAVLLIALLAFLRRRGWNPRPTAREKGLAVLGVLALAAAVILMCLSGSRGAVVAFFAAAAAWSAYGIGRLGAKGRRIVVWTALAFLLAGLLFAGSMSLGFWRKTSSGDTLRTDIVKAVPQMMCDAPGGWGFVGAGKAYRDWYQRLDDRWVTFSLVSDHLTTLVNAGWFWRFTYLFGWLVVLGLLGLAARKRESARLALALGLVMAVSSAFNRIYLDAWSLWIAPAAALAWTCRKVPWRRPGRPAWCVVGVAAILSGGVLVVCALLADGDGFDLRVRADGRRILVKSQRPSAWVVDDGWVLGGGMVGKEIHAAYVMNRALLGLGYVSSVQDLPSSGIRRLVLAGKAGYEFLMGLSEGTFPADFQMPPEIIFLSPPFPPSVIPELLLKNAKVRLTIGEFAALYSDEYKTPPPWVTVVPACELYVPDWIGRCLRE